MKYILTISLVHVNIFANIILKYSQEEMDYADKSILTAGKGRIAY